MKTKEEIVELNKQQADYYNNENTGKSGLRSGITAIWNNLRNGPLNVFMKKYNLKDRYYNTHKEWLGDLNGKKVLDLGCLRGNFLSMYMAERADEYIGIDLSDTAIAHLNRKLTKLNKPKARGLAVDFLSEEFVERDFDVIYAYAVLHHFENLDVLFNRLKEIMKPGGIIISYDPLETSLPVKIVRTAYRPFQSDADWEWPFTKKTLKKFEHNFDVLNVHGILGKSKYGLLMDMLPLNKNYIGRKVNSWIEKDWNTKNILDVSDCMHVTMLLRKSS